MITRSASDLSLAHRAIRKVRTEIARRTFGRPSRWETGRRVVSFTFDDFPDSSASSGASILESFGYRGTYYAAFGLAGQESPSGRVSTVETTKALHDRGHEIGCHTFAHLDCSLSVDREIALDCARNRDVARRNGISYLSSFAFPFGAMDRRSRAIVAHDYATIRSTWRGVNRGLFDLAALRVLPLMMRERTSTSLDLLDQFLMSDGWLVFYTHDVANDASMWGCQPALLDKICRRLHDSKIEVLPVGRVVPTTGADRT